MADTQNPSPVRLRWYHFTMWGGLGVIFASDAVKDWRDGHTVWAAGLAVGALINLVYLISAIGSNAALKRSDGK